MANRSRDKVGEVMEGLDALVREGRVAEVEELLTTLVEGGPVEDESADERETRSYAEGMRDGIALARGLTSGESAGS